MALAMFLGLTVLVQWNREFTAFWSAAAILLAAGLPARRAYSSESSTHFALCLFWVTQLAFYPFRAWPKMSNH